MFDLDDDLIHLVKEFVDQWGVLTECGKDVEDDDIHFVYPGTKDLARVSCLKCKTMYLYRKNLK